MSATILRFPVERVRRAQETSSNGDLIRRALNAQHKARHAQQGEEIDTFAQRMEMLEDLFRCGD